MTNSQHGVLTAVAIIIAACIVVVVLQYNFGPYADLNRSDKTSCETDR